MNPGGGSWPSRAVAAHLRSPRFRVWAALLALVAFVLAMVPLFGVLGFEFAFAMAFAASVAGADLGAAAVRRLRATPALPLSRALPPLRVVFELFGRVALAHLALLAAPLGIIAANALRVQTCDWGFGLLAYAALPGMSLVVATGIGIACGFAAGERKVLRWLAPYLALIALAAHGVWRFCAAPPVFSYNPLCGYFPGNLYDDHIVLAAPFYWARVYQLVWLCALLAAAAVWTDVPSLAMARHARPIGHRRKAAALALAAGTCALALWSHSGSLGFRVDTEDIAEALGGRHETEHFVILYPRGGEIERDIELIAEDHEFRLAQVERMFGVEVPGRITSLYFRDAEQKFRWIGARNVYMAKPWRKEIYVHHESFPHEVLRHEIAHVVAGELGDPLFHVSVRSVAGLPILFNVGLIEGIAVAADWPDRFTRELTPHQAVKAMIALDMLPPLEEMLSTRFFAFSSARSYTVSGSFVRYLYERRGGAGPLGRLYRSGGDFELAYGEALPELARGWLDEIAATDLPPGTAEVVRERFRRRSIFRQVCPHAVARKQVRIDELERGGKLDRAIRIARSMCSDVPSEPRHQLQLANLLDENGELAQAAEIYDDIASESETVSSTLRAEALLSRAAQAGRAGDMGEVARLLDRAAAMPVESGLLRNIQAQRHVARLASPAAAALRGFFWGAGDRATRLALIEAAIVLEPETGFAYYLRGRHTLTTAAPPAVVRSLSRALDLGLPHPLIRRECARLLAEIAYRAGDLAAVERAAAILSESEQPLVMQLAAADWRERLAFHRIRTE